MRKSFSLLTCSFVFIMMLGLSFPREAHAYLDPGTGSYILQVIIGVFVGVLYTLKIYWNNVKFFIKRLVSARKKDGNTGNS